MDCTNTDIDGLLLVEVLDGALPLHYEEVGGYAIA
jgi:hypothetical protein